MTQTATMEQRTDRSPGTTSTWSFDPAHSHVGFAVRHMMITTVKGQFAKLAGGVELDETDPSRARVWAEIDAASIGTGVAARDAHLRSGDFFDVENFPVLSFESRRVEVKGGGRLTVAGDLTIRGITREVVLEVEEEGRISGPAGEERIGYSASTRIDRAEFGLTWNQGLETGGVLVANEVRITLEVQLVRS